MFGKKKLDVDKLFDTCMTPGTKFNLKATDISTCLRSPFQLYCNYFGKESDRDPMPDKYQEQLVIAGIKHEKETNAKLYPDAIPVTWKTPEAGFKMVLDSMADGTSSFLGAPLFYLPDGIYGVIDGLVREKGKSIFGNYHYIIKEIKLARNIKDFHILQAAFYTHMIGKIQGYTPERFYISNMDKEETSFVYDDYKEQLFQTIKYVKEIRKGSIPSATFGSCGYPWHDYCNKMALESKDISLINGISLKKKTALADNGVNNLDDLIRLGISKLIQFEGIGEKTAKNYVLCAKALIENKLIRKSKSIDLPEKKTEIYLDLEGLDVFTAESLDNILTDYLIGIMVRNADNNKDDTKYISFVAHGFDEEQMLKEFIDYIKKQEDYVIYHWHHYEKTHLRKMMEKYDIPQSDRDLILSPEILIDLHPITTSQFVFPFPGTGIKTIAKWLGFSWKHQDVGAMSSIELYLSYVNNSNKSNLDLVLDYNKDDCEATKIIKDWLVEKGPSIV